MPRSAPVALNDLLLRTEGGTVIDLSLSQAVSQEAHIRGAWFAIRSRLAQALGRIKTGGGTVVLTSEDGVLAGLAAADARALTVQPVRYLRGWQRGMARPRDFR